MLAEVLGKRAGVDSVDTRYFLVDEPLRQTAVGKPMAVVECIVLSYDSAAMDTRSFKIIFERVVAGSRRHTVVAKLREGGD